MRRARPWVRLKLAASLDGRTALANGTSRWITSEAARADVHRLRARSSAILTGVGTVIADDPALTVRLPGTTRPSRAPWRVIVDAELATPTAARVLDTAAPTLLFTLDTASAARRAELVRAGVRLETVPGNAHCDLAAVLRRLAALEVNEVWVEAGPRLSGALLAAGLVDELVIYFAPQLLGTEARGMFALGELTALEQRVGLSDLAVRRVGDDLRITARPSNVAGP
jgi:diaminohydroxyphosphoribosylaminopyrimidine deaminase / 5-amino-6-(5-phosphoribosylamino)uracil reductase